MAKISFLLVWTFICIYIGTAGWARAQLEKKIELSSNRTQVESVECNGIIFASLEDCLAYEREKQTNNLFPWVFHIPSFLGIFILSFFFGSLGGVFKIFKEIAIDESSISDTRAFSLPFFGGAMGLILLGISFIIPNAFVANEVVIDPTTILFISLFGGAFSDKGFSWAEIQINRIFDTSTNGDNNE